MRIECVISHDGKNWLLTGEMLALSAPTLTELDAKVRTVLSSNGVLKKGDHAEVFMAFDNSTIPDWIRPYAQHYFNRIVEIEGANE